MKNLAFKSFIGASIEDVLVPLAQLRIEVFKEFPYLYEGSLEYEKAYLQTYIGSENALLFAVFDGEKLVGATTCIPLSHETPEVQKPFIEKGIALQHQFYFGESILLPAYRGQGLGKLFFEVREAHAFRFLDVKACYFCAVERNANHSLRPKNYVPLDTFWQQQGYKKLDDIYSEFSWLDKGENEETKKRMIYWKKDRI